MRWGRPPLPREHGSWVMLAAAYAAGLGTAAAAGRLAPAAGVAGVLFAVAALAFFGVRRPLAMLLRGEGDPAAARRWAAAEAGVALAAGAALLALGRLSLVPIGVAAAALLAVDLQRVRRSPRPTLASELAGAVGLALLGPAAFAAAAGGLPPLALGLGAALALHFVSGVFFVRMKVRWVRRPPATPRDRLETAWDAAVYGAAALLAAWGLARAGLLPALGWLALLPAAARSLGGALLGRRETDFKRLGWRETGYTAVALALWFLALAAGR